MNKKREMWKNALDKLDEKYIIKGAKIAPETEIPIAEKSSKSGNIAFVLAAAAAVVCCIAGVAAFGGNMKEVPVNPASSATTATEKTAEVNADEIMDKFYIDLTTLQTMQASIEGIIAAHEKKIGELQEERTHTEELIELYEQKLKELNMETEAKIAAEVKKKEIEALEKERKQLEEAKAECQKNYEELLKAEEELIQAKADWEKKYAEVSEEENAVTEAMEEYAPVETEESLVYPAFEEKFLLSPPVQPMTVTTYFGYDSWRGDNHYGIDFGGDDFAGKDVCAAADGVVEEVFTMYTPENSDGPYDCGNYITISHENGYKTLYAHLDSACVTVGEEVKRGEVVGTVGNTGFVTEYCLHFELTKDGEYLDPSWYFERGSVKRTLTAEEVADIVAEKAKSGEAVTWSDFDDYYYHEVGHGLYIRQYEISCEMQVLIGGKNPNEAPMYAYLEYEIGDGEITVDLNDYNAVAESGLLPLTD